MTSKESESARACPPPLADQWASPSGAALELPTLRSCSERSKLTAPTSVRAGNPKSQLTDLKQLPRPQARAVDQFSSCGDPPHRSGPAAKWSCHTRTLGANTTLA